MNHTEQRIWLIKELQRDESQLSDYPIMMKVTSRCLFTIVR